MGFTTFEAESFVRDASADLTLVGAPKRTLNQCGKRSSVDKAQTFMRQIERFQLPNAKDWSNLETVWLIRNAIVHDGGKPKREETGRIQRFVKDADPNAPPRILEALAARAMAAFYGQAFTNFLDDGPGARIADRDLAGKRAHRSAWVGECRDCSDYPVTREKALPAAVSRPQAPCSTGR